MKRRNSRPVTCRLIGEIKGPANNRPQLHIHSTYFRGEDGQLSNPEQNAAVTEAAAPSPHLLPAISSAASGISSLSTFSSLSSITDSVMVLIPLFCGYQGRRKRHGFIGVPRKSGNRSTLGTKSTPPRRSASRSFVSNLAPVGGVMVLGLRCGSKQMFVLKSQVFIAWP